MSKKLVEKFFEKVKQEETCVALFLSGINENDEDSEYYVELTINSKFVYEIEDDSLYIEEFVRDWDSDNQKHLDSYSENFFGVINLNNIVKIKEV